MDRKQKPFDPPGTRYERQPYAIYTRYPEGIDGEHAEDLLCPKCGAEEIVILTELDASTGMLGDLAQCWICKHEFKITENCWVVRRIQNDC